MRQLGTLFEKERPNVYKDATLVNHEGFPAFETGIEDRVLQTLMTGNFQNTFYVGRKELATAAVDLFGEMCKHDPALFSKMIVYARNKGFMRAAPVTALAVLSRNTDEYAEKIFDYVIRTPNDLKDFVGLCRGPIRGFGKQPKRMVGRYLNSLSEYHAIKYGARGNGSFSLGDVLRLARPRPEGEKQSGLFRYLIYGVATEGKSVPLDNLPQLFAYECLKRSDNLSSKMEWIEKGRLPHEVTTVYAGNEPGLWPVILRQMPYFALLRHLNALHRAGVLETEQEYIAERLTNREAILRSKIFPYQFQTASVVLDQGAPRVIKDALAQAVEIAFDNVPEVNGTLCIAPDVSGSMGMPMSERGTLKYRDIAALFTAAMWKRSNASYVWPVDVRLYDPGPMPSGMPLTSFAHLLGQFGGGGTEFSLPLYHMLKEGIKVDAFVTITDGEEWHGRGFLDRVREYRQKINPNLKAFLVRIDPYSRYSNVPQNEPGCYRIVGWSDVVLSYIARIMEGEGGQLDYVKQARLSELAGKETSES